MNASKTLASKVIKAITSFLIEFEGADTRPNVILLTAPQKESILKYFPYYINDLGNFVYNKQEYELVITDKDVVGAAFSFYTKYVEDY